MTTYKGFDILDMTHPNRDGTGNVSYNRMANLLDNKTGKRSVDDAAGVSLPQHSFSWFAGSRTDIVKLKAFLAARIGRAIPFWVPTYNRDLVLVGDITGGTQSFQVRDTGYVKYLYSYLSRKYLVFIATDGTFVIRKVTSAINNGDGTETLVVDAIFGATIPAASTLVSFFVLCRLNDDDVQITWHHRSLAEAALSFVEIPKETPA